MQILGRSVFAVSAVLLLASCAISSKTLSNDDDGGHLYTVARATVSGGMCVDGECSSTLEILSDGRMLLNEGEDDEAFSSVSSNDVEELKDAIDTADASTLTRQPADYTCPTAYDGTMTTYEFYGGKDPIKVDTCEYQLNGFEPAVLVETHWRTLSR